MPKSLETADLQANTRAITAEFLIEPTDEHRLWAASMPVVHGTSVASAEAILRTGSIQPYADIVGDVPTISPYLTDSLDIALMQDQYTFWSVGKTSPVEDFPVYFVAKPELVRQDTSLVAMKDIAAHGALVSEVGKKMWSKHNPGKDVEALNQAATEAFFSSIVAGKEFQPIFARFLASHYPDIHDFSYWRDVTYPGEAIDVTSYDHQAVVNMWPGPQLQVLGSVALSEVGYVILTDPDVRTLDGLDDHEIRVAHAQDWATNMDEKAGAYSSPLGFEQSMNRSFYANLVLYQIAESIVKQST